MSGERYFTTVNANKWGKTAYLRVTAQDCYSACFDDETIDLSDSLKLDDCLRFVRDGTYFELTKDHADHILHNGWLAKYEPAASPVAGSDVPAGRTDAW